MRILIFVFAALCLVSVPGFAASQPAITDLKEIPLISEITKLDHFTPDGRDGMIVSGWRDNANAHGYFLFMVMISSLPGEDAGWNIVGVPEDDGTWGDTLRDDPHTVEDYVKSVRFADGKVDGVPAKLLITAARQWLSGETLASPMRVRIDIYKPMPRPENSTGWTFSFERVAKRLTQKRYCNSDLALTQALGLPLPNPYSGPNKDDSCP